MKNRDTFSACHPIVNFVYFGMVVVFTMCFMHPICLMISLFSALFYSIYLRRKKALRFTLIFMLPMLILAAVLSPAFNHEGSTILSYLPTGNPLTLESIIYGIAAAVMLAAVLVWFTCYNEIMTSDKFVYIFGRMIPALSLVISMALGFVPKFSGHLKTVAQAQRCIGRDISTGSITGRIKNGVAIISIMMTWCLENAIETADSMKSRGYGLPGRTAFSIYRFDGRDRLLLTWLIFCGVYVIAGWAAGGLDFRYYPTMKAAGYSAFSVSFMLMYFVLCLTPLIIDMYYENKWKKMSMADMPGSSSKRCPM